MIPLIVYPPCREIVVEGGQVQIDYELDGDKLYPFGVGNDTTNLDDAFSDAPVAVAEATINPPSSAGQEGLSSYADNSWRAQLSVGDLIDACNRAKVWYQVCLYEMKIAIGHVEAGVCHGRQNHGKFQWPIRGSE